MGIDLSADIVDGQMQGFKVLKKEDLPFMEELSFMELDMISEHGLDVPEGDADTELLNKWRSGAGSHVEPELVSALVEFFHWSQHDGSVLVFLPGLADMLAVESALEGCPSADSLWVRKCHSGLPSQEQKLVFHAPPEGKRKVVLATNIAESSITLPDVLFVIDTGLRKENLFNAEYEASNLTTLMVSKTNAIQRRGRAGRVRPGVCVHLFPRAAMQALQDYPMPEILRTPLEELCLGVLCLGVSDVEAFLQEAMDPPKTDSTAHALASLQQLQCVEVQEGLPKITVVGRQLAALPVPPQLGRLLLVSSLLGCLSPAATICASMSLKSPFAIATSQEGRAQANRVRKRLFEELPPGLRSDQLLLLNVYDTWAVEGDSCCRDMGLSRASIQAIHFARKQLIQRTTSLLGRSVTSAHAAEFADRHTADRHLLLAAVAAALYPSCAFPQVGKLESGGGGKQQWRTRDGYSARPRQESTLSDFRSTSARDDGDSQGMRTEDFAVFSERSVAHSGLQLGDCSLTSALPFVITAKRATCESNDHLELDGWLRFPVQSPTQLQTLAGLSSAFGKLLVNVCAGQAWGAAWPEWTSFLDTTAELLSTSCSSWASSSLNSPDPPAVATVAKPAKAAAAAAPATTPTAAVAAAPAAAAAAAGASTTVWLHKAEPKAPQAPPMPAWMREDEPVEADATMEDAGIEGDATNATAPPEPEEEDAWAKARKRRRCK